MTAPLGVLFIENSIGLSGSTISLCTLLTHLDRQRYAPCVVFSRPEQEVYFRRHGGNATPSATIQCKDSLKFSRLVGRMLTISKALSQRLEHLAFKAVALLDVVFVTAPYVAKLYFFARRHEVALIHHNNGFDVAGVLLARILRVPLVAYQRGDEWNSPMVRYLSRFVTLYIANSEATKRSVRSLGIAPERIEVIYPAIDFSTFDYQRPPGLRRETFGVTDADRCFGILGPLQESKGQHVFLRAASRVMEAIPDSKAFIIGDAPNGGLEYKEFLIALAQELGIRDRVVFTGFRVDIPDLLHLLDIVVLASLTPEGFGRVVAEAMAMKKPVIATMTGGPGEIIENQKTGLLVAPGDQESLSKAIIELLRDRRRAREIGERAYVSARSRFSVASQVQRVQAIYDRTVASCADSGVTP